MHFPPQVTGYSGRPFHGRWPSEQAAGPGAFLYNMRTGLTGAEPARIDGMVLHHPRQADACAGRFSTTIYDSFSSD